VVTPRERAQTIWKTKGVVVHACAFGSNCSCCAIATLKLRNTETFANLPLTIARWLSWTPVALRLTDTPEQRSTDDSPPPRPSSSTAGLSATAQSQGSRGCYEDKEMQTSPGCCENHPLYARSAALCRALKIKQATSDAIGPDPGQASLDNGTSGLPSANPSLRRSHSP
jgi:hypothetical protein